MNRPTLQPRNKRLFSPIAWLMIAILLVVSAYNVAPYFSRLMTRADAESNTVTIPTSTQYATTDLVIPAATRGGECNERSQFVARNGTAPNTKMNWLGFRCARDVKPAPEVQN